MTNQGPPESMRTVVEALERTASDRESEPFLRHRDRTISYGEINQQANAIANGLVEQGVDPGDHVGLLMYNNMEFVSTFFALSKLGAVAAPIDTRFTGETLVYVLSESDIGVLLVDSYTYEEYDAVRDDIPQQMIEFFVGGERFDQRYQEFEDLLRFSSDPLDRSLNGSNTMSLTYVQQHPTDQPKGVLMPQFAYVNTAWEAAKNLFDYYEDDRLFTTLPLYSILTFQLGVMGALLSGAEFVFETRFEPERFWDQIESYDATVFLYLSRMLSVLYNQDIDPKRGTTPAELGVGASPGFASDEALFRDFEDRFDLTILEGYGTTSVSTIATYNRRDERNLESVGKPPSYVNLAIVDESGWPVPTGERGEIVVRPTRPNSMMSGYYKNLEQTVEDCRNQWIHTGGIGYRDEDGYVYFVATKENSIYRGRIAGRISSLEIESVVNALPEVEAVTVFGVMNERGGEDIKVVIVPADDVDITPVDICRHCEKQLPYLKVPRYIEIRNQLPRNPSGKIRMDKLRSAGSGDAWDRESGYELSR